MENILAKKLQLKQDKVIAVVNSPKEYMKKLNIDSLHTTVYNKIKQGCGFIQYFTMDMQNLKKALAELKKILNSGEIIWITYPKQSSGVKTDLNRDVCAEISQKFGFTTVALVSIDETWSALRIKQVTGDKSKKDKEELSSIGNYINSNKKIVTPPEDLLKAMRGNKKANEFFNSLAFSHKKEYVQWILDAKKEETRKKRIEKTINMLLTNRKNPFS